jgi:hypothetical protein
LKPGLLRLPKSRATDIMFTPGPIADLLIKKSP